MLLHVIIFKSIILFSNSHIHLSRACVGLDKQFLRTNRCDCGCQFWINSYSSNRSQQKRQSGSSRSLCQRNHCGCLGCFQSLHIVSKWRVKCIPKTISFSLLYRVKPLDFEIPVYNFCVPASNPLTWSDFTSKTVVHGMVCPPLNAMWYFFFTNNRSKLVDVLSKLLFHYLPAILVDTFLFLSGKKPK